MDVDGSNVTRLTNNPALDNHAALSPDGTKIVFSSNRAAALDASNRATAFDLYLMDADGSDPTRLTDDAGNERGAAWSPDGRRIAFHSDLGDIYVMDADGSNRTKLTNDVSDGASCSRCRGNAFPRWSPDGTRIAFHSERDGNAEIYVMDADGSNPTRLTNSAGFDANPAWSPDGTRIAFTSNRIVDNPEIFVMDADGSNQTRVTNDPAFDSLAVWSPDGTRIVFESDPDGNADIFVMDADGSNRVKLTNNAGIDTASAWSSKPQQSAPTAGTIAFASEREGNFDVFVIDATGSDPENLTNNPAFDGYPDWSPDGTRIAFMSTRDDNVQIYLMNADGSHVTALTSSSNQNSYPAWSPDGGRIAFTSSLTPDDADIYVVNTDGSNPTNLTNNPSADSTPAWSPDGTRIAFTSERGGQPEIYVMDADGSNPTKLTEGSLPAWSPDGTRIAFTSSRTLDDADIYVVDADGSNVINLTNHSAFDGDAAWSPDGSLIMYGSDRSGSFEIYVMDPDGSDMTRLTSNPATDASPAWTSAPRQALSVAALAEIATEAREQYFEQLVTIGWETFEADVGWSIMHPSDWTVGGADETGMFLVTPNGGQFAVIIDFVPPIPEDSGSFDYLLTVIETAFIQGVIDETAIEILQLGVFAPSLSTTDVNFNGQNDLLDIIGVPLAWAVDPSTFGPLPDGFDPTTEWRAYYDPAAEPAVGYMFQTLGGDPLLIQAGAVAQSFIPASGYPFVPVRPTSGTMNVSSDTTLKADHLGNIVITANNITLDCDGHTVSGSGFVENEFGIVAFGLRGVTITNCLVEGFGNGIKLENTHDSTVSGNSTTDNIEGISLSSSTGNTISDNRSDRNEFDGFLIAGSDDNLIIRNEASGNSVGFSLEGSNSNRLIDNVATGSSYLGLEDLGDDNVFEQNVFE